MLPQSSQAKQFIERMRASLRRDLCQEAARTITKHAHVYPCGNCDVRVYVIEHGHITLLALSPDGKQSLLAIYTAGKGFVRDLTRRMADQQQVIAHLVTVDSQETSLQRCATLRYGEPQENILNAEARHREFLYGKRREHGANTDAASTLSVGMAYVRRPRERPGR
jgi:hypothetical protein